jgi:hypothetical protein
VGSSLLVAVIGDFDRLVAMEPTAASPEPVFLASVGMILGGRGARLMAAIR